MTKNFRRKSALSTPVASLIVLVVSVLLSSVVSYFAINVTRARVQQEKLYLSKVYVWYENSTSSLGCLVVTNTGATDIVLSKIAIKGRDSPWNGTTTFVLYNKTEEILSADLEFVSNFNQTGSNVLNLDGINYTLVVASENLILQSGWTMLFYIVNPQGIVVYDVGTPAGVTVSTGQAVYSTETNVKAA